MSQNYSSYVVLDLEATGLDPEQDDITEVAIIKVQDGEIIDRLETFVYTPLELSEHISYLTGITAQDLEGAPDFRDLISDIEAFIGDLPLVGHNIFFDWNFLVQKGVQIEENQLWDTYIMSTLLYPELPSHSLETNTKYFGIAHEDSHRAMADVIASHELWLILMQTFPEISAAQKEQLQALAQKTTWPLMDFFLQDLPAQKKPFQFDSSKEQPELQLPDLTDLSPEDSSSKPLFIHSPGVNPITLAAGLNQPKRTLYVASYQHRLKTLQELLPESYTLHSPYHYCNPDKLEYLQQKKQYDTAETVLLLRLALMGANKPLNKLSLSHPERAVWKTLAEESKDWPARKESLQHDTVLMTQSQLFADIDYLQQVDQLVILEPQFIEENATRQLGKNLSIESWQEQSEDLDWNKKGEGIFTEIEKLGNALVPSTVYPEHVALDQLIIQSNEFIRIKSSLLEVISEHQEDEKLSVYLKYFQVFLQVHEASWVRWITVDPKRGVSVNVAPLSVKSLLQKQVFDAVPTTIISHTIDQYSWLPEAEKKEKSIKQDIKISLPELEAVKGTKKDGDHPAQISYLADFLPTLKGKTGVIFSSKTNVKRYFFDLAKVLPKATGLFAEDITGSKGKLMDRYTSDAHEDRMLFITYRSLRAFPSHLLDFDNIVIHALPFDYPGHPVYAARSEQYSNAFIDFTIPQVQQNLLEITSNFTQRDGQKILSVIDRRVQEKEYGRELIELLA